MLAPYIFNIYADLTINRCYFDVKYGHKAFSFSRSNRVRQIKLWTERLHEAFELARTFSTPNNPNACVIQGKHGCGFGKRGFSHHWEDARRRASIKLGYVLDCTFHDLKAKGISDYEGSSRDKQLFSGHKTESQVLIYDRKTKVSPTLNRPPIQEKYSNSVLTAHSKKGLPFGNPFF